jgi:hypothetical protein
MCMIHYEYLGTRQPEVECEDCWQVWVSLQPKKKDWYTYQEIEYKEQNVPAAKVLKDLKEIYDAAILDGYNADEITLELYTSHDNWGEFEYSSLDVRVYRDESDNRFNERMEYSHSLWKEKLYLAEKTKVNEYEYYKKLKLKYEGK